MEGPQQTAGVFNQDFKKGCALGVRGDWKRPARTKPQVHSRPDHCSPPVLCQPKGSIQGPYNVAFTVSVISFKIARQAKKYQMTPNQEKSKIGNERLTGYQDNGDYFRRFLK